MSISCKFHESLSIRYSVMLLTNKDRGDIKLECMHSENTPAAPWLPILLTSSYWIPSQNKVKERTRFSKSRSNTLEDLGQGQRSSHATHLLMLMIICTKYGKNPSRTVDATERTRFSRSRPNDLENIGQGQRSLHETHPLMLMMICPKYGKNARRIADFFSRWKEKKLEKLAKNWNFRILL